MLNRTYISTSAKEAQENKTWRGRRTLAGCSSAAGHMIKSGIRVQGKEPTHAQKANQKVHVEGNNILT